MTQTTRTQGFARIIEGAYGTLVFGAGVPAIEGEIIEVSDDYVFIQTPAPDGSTLAVPLWSIVYFRFSDDA